MRKWLARLLNVCFRDAYAIVTPKDNRRLSAAEFNIARQICEEVLQSVQIRQEFVSSNGTDPKFALPDANWSYGTPNEYLDLFRRVSRAEKDVIENLRGKE